VISIEEQWRVALARFRRSAWRKIIDPGLATFAIRYFARRQRSGLRKHTKLFFGPGMDIVLPEVVSEQIYTYGFFDDIVTWLALSATRPGDVVFDIGAHFGYFSLLFATLVGPKGRVVAFEPTPSTFSLLEHNVAGLDNVLAVNAALGQTEGGAELNDYGLRHCAWNSLAEVSRLSPDVLGQPVRLEHVKLRALDNFVFEYGIAPTLVKIDAENFESEIIKGGHTTLSRLVPMIIMETGTSASLEACRALLGMGYRPHVSDKVGHLEPWTLGIEAVNLRYKDILFDHPSRPLPRYSVSGGENA